MGNVAYRKIYEKYEIAVIILNDGNYDVTFMMKDSNTGISIEVCESEHHAVKGAEKFPTYYELAMKHGFYLGQIEFKHPDGREIHYSYAMDLDRTESSFENLLITGGR